MRISDDIKYVGVNDHDIDLFEGQYMVENGMAYNSYVILDEKIAVFDTVDANFGEEWLANVATVLNGRQPDYPAYGTGSLGKRHAFRGKLPANAHRGKLQGIYHDEAIFRHGFFRQPAHRERGRHAFPRKA